MFVPVTAGMKTLRTSHTCMFGSMTLQAQRGTPFDLGVYVSNRPHINDSLCQSI
jgi:hypothetical protein